MMMNYNHNTNIVVVTITVYIYIYISVNTHPQLKNDYAEGRRKLFKSCTTCVK